MRRPSIHEKATLLGDAVFGANDGIITTFAVVAGATGANLSPNIIVILGFANLFADAISMASGNYLGVKSALEYQDSKKVKVKHYHSPISHGLVTFGSFVIAGLLPLLPFVLKLGPRFLLSAFVVGLSLFAVGSLRTLYSKKSWFTGGMEVLLIGGVAATVAYSIGFLLDKYVV